MQNEDYKLVIEKRVLSLLEEKNRALATEVAAQVKYLTKRQNRIVAIQWTIVVIQFLTTAFVLVKHAH